MEFKMKILMNIKMSVGVVYNLFRLVLSDMATLTTTPFQEILPVIMQQKTFYSVKEYNKQCVTEIE